MINKSVLLFVLAFGIFNIFSSSLRLNLGPPEQNLSEYFVLMSNQDEATIKKNGGVL